MARDWWPDDGSDCTQCRAGRGRPETPRHCWRRPVFSSCLRPCIPSLLLVHREVVNIKRANPGWLGVPGDMLDNSNFHLISLATPGRYVPSQQPRLLAFDHEFTSELLLVHREVVNVKRANSGWLGVLRGVLDD